jgi:hypothetical protein
MAVCQKCNGNNSDAAIFCSNCGAKLLPQSSIVATGSMVKTGQAEHNSKAVTSMILGIGSVIMWILLFAQGSLIAASLGTLSAVTSLVLGMIGLKSRKAGMSIVGIIASIIGLILTSIFGLMIILESLGISDY